MGSRGGGEGASVEFVELFSEIEFDGLPVFSPIGSTGMRVDSIVTTVFTGEAQPASGATTSHTVQLILPRSVELCSPVGKPLVE